MLIVVCAASLVTLSAAVTLASHMKFKSSASVYLGELQGNGAQSGLPDQLDFLGGRNGEIGTEIEILRSQDLLRRAVFESGLNATALTMGWTPPRYLEWRLHRRDPLRLEPTSSSFTVVDASLPEGAPDSVAFTLQFQGGGDYKVSGGAAFLGQGRLGVPFTSDQVRMTLLPGNGAPPVAGTTVMVTVRPLDDVAAATAKALVVAVPKTIGSTDSVKIVSLEFTGPTPRMTAAFVGKLLQLYFDRHQTWKSEEATAAESFVTTQVQAVKHSLDDAEQQLADFKKKAGVIALGDDTKQLIDQLGKYEQQRVAAQLQVDAFDQISGAIKRGHGNLEQYLVGEAEDPVLVSMSNQLAEAQDRLTTLRERFTDEAPAIKEQQAQVEAQLAMVNRYIQNRHARSQQQLDALSTMISKFDERLSAVPGAELQLSQLTRNTEVLSKMYSFLLERQEQAMVAKAANISRNHILDSPRIPTREDSPSLPVRLAMGLVFGLFVGLAAAVIRWATRETFQTDADVRRDLGPLPIFASVPRHQSARNGLTIGGDRTAPVAQPAGYPSSPFAEAFRHLRTNIYYSDASRSSRVLLITSPCPGDGKTVCTLQLASALSADGKRVLVIEADLRRPSHHLFLKQKSEPGLGDLSVNDHIVRAIHGWFGTFDSILAGAPSDRPAELLSSASFGELIRQARNVYDFVLIDSPPFPLVSDALIVAMHVDRVLSVVRPGNTRRTVAREHLQRLSAASRLHSVVINDTSAAEAYSNYGSYRHPPGSRFRFRKDRRGGDDDSRKRAMTGSVHS